MYKTMCHPYVHTGPPGSHRYSPGSYSLPSILSHMHSSAVPSGPRDADPVSEHRPPTFSSYSGSRPICIRCICTWGATGRESRAAGLGHKVQGGPALAPDPSGQLETCERPWLLCGKGSLSLAAHQPDLSREGERITGEGGLSGGEGLLPLPPARTQES